ncbi:MAG: nucleoside triphosphate pyrophosphohydrolase [Oscillospiraceae bacterium]|nr:nucleoside triphosphate pyrophosphohydrolase [Oscillospiraceae bacterium]
MVELPDLREFLDKKRYDTQDLRRIVQILRAPGGCPWDARQTHASIRKNFIEETYEAVEAIDKGDDALLCEELGDVLLQVGLHTQMASERGAFDWDDVTDGICRKLIERHPHVFGDVNVTGVENVLSNWDAIKRKSKGQRSTAQAMDSVPRELPALMRAQKLQQKAAKAGFDWREETPLRRLELDLLGEVEELREALLAGDLAHAQDELGDVLFSAVNIARVLPGCDAEEALTGASDRFSARFAVVEQLAAEQGVDMKTAPVEELDRLWALAKNSLKEKK